MSEPTRLTGALAASEAKLLACVHCGLCLEACPTYVETGDENDGPRGRIYLMRAVEERRLAADSEAFTRHIDRCLGCRACESACPAGVEYGQLLEAARSDIATRGRPRGWTGRATHFVLRRVWLQPKRLRLAMSAARALRDSGLARLLLASHLARLVAPRLHFALALLVSSSPTKMTTANHDAEAGRDTADEVRAHEGAPTSEALLFEGCVTEGLFARVNRATARVLEANGCRVRAPRGQVCCGALHAHAGDLDGARRLARLNLEAFGASAEADGAHDETGNRAAPVVTNAGGCGAMLASYGHLLADDETYAARAASFARRVRDVSQQLSAAPLRRGAPLEGFRVTYDASCHLLHGQRANVEPLRLLAALDGAEFVPLEGADVCCGGAGVYNLVEPELASRILEEKMRHVQETRAQVLATGNPGCHMQLGAGALLRGLTLRVVHPVELLDESYRRAGLYEK